MERSDEILTVDSLKIGYRAGKKQVEILPPLSASARVGELVAVIGRNGVGKSTLLRTIAGLQPLLGGTLCINGRNINDYSRIELSREIGYISTEIIRVSNMSVYDLASIGRYPHTDWLGRIDDRNHIAVIDALRKAGMENFSSRLISELSDGERQRAMISMVLAQDAPVMVMDEPTAFLDIGSKFEILHLLHDLTRQRKKTVIFSTHDLNATIGHADRIWLLLDGHIEQGAPEDIMLSGSFRNLFDRNIVKFSMSDGSFSIMNEVRGTISVEGSGTNKLWTRKALIRAGYNVTESDSEIVVTAPEKGASKWICKTDQSEFEFSSIYDLIDWIRSHKPITG